MAGERVRYGPACRVVDVWRTASKPSFGCLSVSMGWVDKIGFHARKCVCVAQIVSLATDGLGDHIDGESCVVDLDGKRRSQNGTQHVIVDDIGLKRGGHQPRLGACRLRDEIGPGLRRQRHRKRFFKAGLCIGKLAVCGPGYGRIGQIIEAGQLCSSSGQHSLFATAARHAARPQICHHGPRAVNRTRLGVQCPRKHHPRECFGIGLRETARNGHRARCAHLSECVDHHRDAGPHSGGHHLTGVGIKTQWRHRVIDVERQKRFCAKGRLGPGDSIAHLRNVIDMCRIAGADHDVFRGPRQRGEGCIDIQRMSGRHIAGDH